MENLIKIENLILIAIYLSGVAMGIALVQVITAFN